ncbi:MAG: hypothetical protein LC791_15095 [Acidobacteria bacterium]|nr:hypothetical protein [Acidobacteriota bacterium]
MFARKFQGVTDEELADIWFALGCAAARYGDPFRRHMADVIRELRLRRGRDVMPYLNHRKRSYQGLSDPEPFNPTIG